MPAAGRRGTTTERVIDLTGKPTPWTAAIRRMWISCLGSAGRSAPLSCGTPHTGEPGLRSALADMIGQPMEHVVVTTGVRAAVRGLITGAPEVIVEKPTFSGVPLSLDQLGARWRYGSWKTILREATAGALKSGTVLWITSPARNPDGHTADRAIASELSAAAQFADARIVQNLSYLWYRPDAATVPGATIVFGLHKIAGPGARLGCAAGPDVVARLRPELRGGSPPLVWQLAWGRFIAAGGLSEITRHGVSAVVAARRAFLADLDGHPHTSSIDGPSLLLSLGVPAATAIHELAAVGVLAGAGPDFAAPDDTVRLCFSDVDTDRAHDAARRIAALASRLRWSPWIVKDLSARHPGTGTR